MVETRLTSITFKWKPIPENLTNGYLLGYKTRYRKFFGGEYAYLIINWDSQSIPQAKITTLENSTIYEISISGYTAAGTGPYSGRLTVKTKQCKFKKLCVVYIKIIRTIIEEPLSFTAW